MPFLKIWMIRIHGKLNIIISGAGGLGVCWLPFLKIWMI